jgi:hypothetical protein
MSLWRWMVCSIFTGSENGPLCRTSSRSSRRHQNGGMNRSADWLHQAQADLELAGVSGCRRPP